MKNSPVCPVCGEPMKPLFQTYFCDVNECDLPEEKRRAKPRIDLSKVTKAAKVRQWDWTGLPIAGWLPAAVTPDPPAFCDCPRRPATMYHQGRVICLSCNLEVPTP